MSNPTTTSPSNPPVKDAPAFDFYPERWIAGTRHMTKAERSDYLELLCIQWLEDGLPDDLDRMARIVGYKHAGQLSPQVMEKFVATGDDKRRNRRLEVERVAQRERIAKRREGAKKTNGKRWGDKSLGDRSATPERDESETAGDIAGESPPPTPHPLPPTTTTTTTTPEGLPATEVEAGQWAESFSRGNVEGLRITPEIVTHWYGDRQIVGWITVKHGAEVPIRDWQEDLKKFARAWWRLEQERPAAKPPRAAKGPPNTTPLSSKTPVPEKTITVRKL